LSDDDTDNQPNNIKESRSKSSNSVSRAMKSSSFASRRLNPSRPHENELIDLTEDSPYFIDLTNDSPILSTKEIPDLHMTDHEDEGRTTHRSSSSSQLGDPGPPNSSPEPEPMNIDTDIGFMATEKEHTGLSQSLGMVTCAVKANIEREYLDHTAESVKVVSNKSNYHL
jgi:hypothetical protein